MPKQHGHWYWLYIRSPMLSPYVIVCFEAYRCQWRNSFDVTCKHCCCSVHCHYFKLYLCSVFRRKIITNWSQPIFSSSILVRRHLTTSTIARSFRHATTVPRRSFSVCRFDCIFVFCLYEIELTAVFWRTSWWMLSRSKMFTIDDVLIVVVVVMDVVATDVVAMDVFMMDIILMSDFNVEICCDF